MKIAWLPMTEMKMAALRYVSVCRCVNLGRRFKPVLTTTGCLPSKNEVQ